MKETNGFGRFDIVSDSDCFDHHFLRSYKGDGDWFKNPNSAVHKKIMKEWRTLEKSLPESIYVRVYERRIDLMRAVIVGAAGTPYHDGLFFFDIAFPFDYPNQPPKLYFHSFGIRLNPNLYANGKVCLSLLNTWYGTKNEKWDPYGSTLLQVLLSIQGLVLNENPYFNEPGYETPANFGYERKSRVYNEKAFSLTCNISVYLLQKPPRGFEHFVRAHFSERAREILTACKAYESGRVRVGYHGCASLPSSTTVQVSKYFQAWMKSSYSRMVDAFRKNDTSLRHFVEHLELQPEHPMEYKEQSRNQKSGFFKRAMEKFKHTFGWKKSGKKKLGSLKG